MHADAAKKADTRLYSIWENMKTRCYNEKAPKYEIYGKKGIKVCKEWRESFDAFHDWAVSNGYNNSLSIDRIDPNGDYKPSNCRWANNTEQAENKSNARIIIYKGKELDIDELSRKTGLAVSTLYHKTDEEIKNLLQHNDGVRECGFRKCHRMDSIFLDQTYYTDEGYLVHCFFDTHILLGQLLTRIFPVKCFRC